MFLPVNKTQLSNPDEIDFVVVSSDAYVDHPSFGHAIIARLVESCGFTVGIIPQPLSDSDYRVFPIPKHAYLVSGGVVDSMVNNYTAFKRKRSDDVYSPKSKRGKRPDRQLTVYSRALKRLFPDTPVIIGGIEASLRRFAHYDYWSDSVMRSVLFDSGADMLIYGMGEKPIIDICGMAAKGVPLNKLKDVRGTCVMLTEKERERLKEGTFTELESFEEVASNKLYYAKSFKKQMRETDALNAVALIQKQADDAYLFQNLPQFPLTESEMDAVYALPYMRSWHPMYDAEGGIDALAEVKFSVTSHRGCFGSCSFCALNYHQGRRVQKRGDAGILAEIEALTADKDFKGYIHDLSGPSANFREPSCDKQLTKGVCKDRFCIGWEVCPNLKVDHSGLMNLLDKAERIPKVKKVFLRSGIRFDYVMLDKNPEVLEKICRSHVSGQLKVAPEHASDTVLKLMNKPRFSVYLNFSKRYEAVNAKLGKKQYLVPYLITAHPGCGYAEAVELTEYLKSINFMPEQAQDFYPTPSTRSTCMYYTGIDPWTMKEVSVPKSGEERKVQRALLRYRLPENAELVKKAYKICGKTVEKRQVDRKRIYKHRKK